MARRIVQQPTKRVVTRDVAATAAGADLTQYWDRLKNLIPAEVAALYIAGTGVIPAGQTPLEQSIGPAVWALFCLALVVLFMAKATQQAEGDTTRYPTDWTHVGIASVSFVVWVYALGGVFVGLGLYVPWIGTLLMLGWTAVVPFLYKGPRA